MRKKFNISRYIDCSNIDAELVFIKFIVITSFIKIIIITENNVYKVI